MCGEPKVLETKYADMRRPTIRLNGGLRTAIHLAVTLKLGTCGDLISSTMLFLSR